MNNIYERLGLAPAKSSTQPTSLQVEELVDTGKTTGAVSSSVVVLGTSEAAPIHTNLNRNLSNDIARLSTTAAPIHSNLNRNLSNDIARLSTTATPGESKFPSFEKIGNYAKNFFLGKVEKDTDFKGFTNGYMMLMYIPYQVGRAGSYAYASASSLGASATTAYAKYTKPDEAKQTHQKEQKTLDTLNKTNAIAAKEAIAIYGGNASTAFERYAETLINESTNKKLLQLKSINDLQDLKRNSEFSLTVLENPANPLFNTAVDTYTLDVKKSGLWVAVSTGIEVTPSKYIPGCTTTKRVPKEALIKPQQAMLANLIKAALRTQLAAIDTALLKAEEVEAEEVEAEELEAEELEAEAPKAATLAGAFSAASSAFTSLFTSTTAQTVPTKEEEVVLLLKNADEEANSSTTTQSALETMATALRNTGPGAEAAELAAAKAAELAKASIDATVTAGAKYQEALQLTAAPFIDDNGSIAKRTVTQKSFDDAVEALMKDPSTGVGVFLSNSSEGTITQPLLSLVYNQTFESYDNQLAKLLADAKKKNLSAEEILKLVEEFKTKKLYGGKTELAVVQALIKAKVTQDLQKLLGPSVIKRLTDSTTLDAITKAGDELVAASARVKKALADCSLDKTSTSDQTVEVAVDEVTAARAALKLLKTSFLNSATLLVGKKYNEETFAWGIEGNIALVVKNAIFAAKSKLASSDIELIKSPFVSENKDSAVTDAVELVRKRALRAKVVKKLKLTANVIHVTEYIAEKAAAKKAAELSAGLQANGNLSAETANKLPEKEEEEEVASLGNIQTSENKEQPKTRSWEDWAKSWGDLSQY